MFFQTRPVLSCNISQHSLKCTKRNKWLKLTNPLLAFTYPKPLPKNTFLEPNYGPYHKNLQPKKARERKQKTFATNFLAVWDASRLSCPSFRVDFTAPWLFAIDGLCGWSRGLWAAPRGFKPIGYSFKKWDRKGVNKVELAKIQFGALIANLIGKNGGSKQRKGNYKKDKFW